MSILSGKTISFIGGGNMTSAIVDGLLKLKKTSVLILRFACLTVTHPSVMLLPPKA